MTEPRFTALAEAFDRLVELDPAARREALAALPEDLASEVRRLLEADTEVDDPVNAVLEQLGESQLRERAPGARLGPWRVLRELGAGGMGTVLLAERADGQFEQQAAIKLIRGFPTEDGRRRLRQERQILAQLDHPCIARLLDGGETADGQPWVAMEYVDGQALSDYVARQRPDFSARLQLFDRIAEAVEHAHQRLVIHRDLKPGNVLVRADGSPKLLDFGVAKLIDLGFDSGRRDTSTRVWTPGYASPEQRHGQPITTASDVYALGVMLGEILGGPPTGQFELAEFPSLQPDAELRGVLAMACAENPTQRYPTVEALREELRRYVEGRPVRAAADTRRYRIRKFIRRHRLPVAAAALVLTVLAGFAWRLQVERAAAVQARGAAELAQQRALQQYRFLATIFQGASGLRADGRPMLAVDLIDRARERLDGELSAQPDARAQVENMLGSVYLNAGRYADAKAMYLAAAEHGVDSLAAFERAGFLREAARMALLTGSADEAAQLLDHAGSVLGPAPYAPDEVETAVRIRFSRILLMKHSGDPRREALINQSLQEARSWLRPDHTLLALLLGEQAALSEAAGRHAQLLQQRREIVQMFERNPQAYALDLAVQRLNLVRALALNADLDAAEAELERARGDLDRAFGDVDHRNRANLLLQQAGLQQLRGRLAEALADGEAALAMIERLDETAEAADLMWVAELALAQRQRERARELYLKAGDAARSAQERERAERALAALAEH